MAKELEVVKNLDVEKYMGRWYEIASFPSGDQPKDGVNTRATYKLNADRCIHVLNETWSGGKRLFMEGTALKCRGDEAKFKILFNVPRCLPILSIWGNYWVLFIDEAYQYALIGEPSRERLWILSKIPHLHKEKYSQLVERAKREGYDVSKLRKIPQSDPPPEDTKDTKGVWWINSIFGK